MGQFFWNFMASHFFKLCQTAKCFRNKIYNEIVPFPFFCHKNFEVFQFLFTEKKTWNFFNILCISQKVSFFLHIQGAQTSLGLKYIKANKIGFDPKLVLIQNEFWSKKSYDPKWGLIQNGVDPKWFLIQNGVDPKWF